MSSSSSSSTRQAQGIPPLLEQALALPRSESLIALTGVLGANVSWLAMHFVASYLGQGGPSGRAGVGDDDHTAANDDNDDAGAPANDDGADDVKMVVVSFMRDFQHWNEGVGRLGVDLMALSAQDRFRFVDGMAWVFVQHVGEIQPGPNDPKGMRYLDGFDLDHIADVVHDVIDRLRTTPETKVVLMVDNIDVFLSALTGRVNASRLHFIILEFREKAHATIFTTVVDRSLLNDRSTTMGRGHNNFVLGLAHDAAMVLSVRPLRTGPARDVSGVVRITRGGAEVDPPVQEGEYLYHIGSEQRVTVFERGA